MLFKFLIGCQKYLLHMFFRIDLRSNTDYCLLVYMSLIYVRIKTVCIYIRLDALAARCRLLLKFVTQCHAKIRKDTCFNSTGTIQNNKIISRNKRLN